MQSRVVAAPQGPSRIPNRSTLPYEELPSSRALRTSQPPRVSRRLQLLRRWSHEQVEQSSRLRSVNGPCGWAGAPRGIPVVVGGRGVDRAEDRLPSADVAGMGQAPRGRCRCARRDHNRGAARLARRSRRLADVSSRRLLQQHNCSHGRRQAHLAASLFPVENAKATYKNPSTSVDS